MAKGRFITFEGVEGAGKSLQAETLAVTLESRGIPALLTREPGGSAGGEMIRELLLNGSKERWDPLTEAILFNAARRDHVTRKILPALEQGIWVVCDRFVDSTLAYQGCGHGVDIDELVTLQYIAIGELLPDLTIILDVPVPVGLDRTAQRHLAPDRFEQLDLDFHQRVRCHFLTVGIEDIEGIALIDADASAAAVTEAVIATVQSRLGVQLR